MEDERERWKEDERDERDEEDERDEMRRKEAQLRNNQDASSTTVKLPLSMHM